MQTNLKNKEYLTDFVVICDELSSSTLVLLLSFLGSSAENHSGTENISRWQQRAKHINFKSRKRTFNPLAVSKKVVS